MAADALKTPGAAVLLAFIGDVLQDKGDLQGALKMYQRSQHIREATQTVDSIWGAHQLSQTGSLHLDLGNDAFGSACPEGCQRCPASSQ